jgi:hypothetical protein
MRRLLLLLALMAGCGGDKFATEAEELSYLSALSDPSPAQWKRRQELQMKAAREADAAAKGKAREELAARRAAADAEGRMSPGERIAALMARAAGHEAKGDYNEAFICYKDLVEGYPAAPEAATAREKAAIAHEKAYGFRISLP